MANIESVSTIIDFSTNKLLAYVSYSNGGKQDLSFDIPKPDHGLVGVTTEPLLTSQLVKDYPGIKYMRDFGVGRPLPRLSEMNESKFITADKNTVMHVSWKSDVEALKPWLDRLTRPVYITWYHEPMGDVKPSTYRVNGERVANIIRAHKNRHLVLGNGPIVTRYWLDEGNGNPDDWAYPGMTFYGVDCYSPKLLLPEVMFKCFKKVEKYNVDILVPEWGIEGNAGESRAAYMLAQGSYLLSHPRVKAFSYWNNWDQYRFASNSPEADAMRKLLA